MVTTACAPIGNLRGGASPAEENESASALIARDSSIVTTSGLRIHGDGPSLNRRDGNCITEGDSSSPDAELRG